MQVQVTYVVDKLTTYKIEVGGVKVEFDADLAELVTTIDALEKRNVQQSGAAVTKNNITSKVVTGHSVNRDSSPDVNLSLAKQIRSLIKEGFFNEYRASAQVQSRLTELGYKHELQSISSRLGKLNAPKSKNIKPELTRKKIGPNKFAYKAISEDDTTVVQPVQPTPQSQ